MRAIVLCRHGATAENLAGRFLSRSDEPLSELGEEQARGLAAALAEFPFERCFVSPMRRCVQTREIAVPSLTCEIDDALREVNFGQWEGRTLEWIQSNDPQRLAQRRHEPVAFRPPGGESFADLAVRLRKIAARLADERCALVIAHRGTLGVLERLLRGLPLESQVVKPLEPGEFRVVA